MTEKTVIGKNLQGEDRKYVFNLIDAKTGTRLFHEYVSILLKSVPEEFMQQIQEGGQPEQEIGINIRYLIDELNKNLPFEKLEELTTVLMRGALIYIGNKEYVADPDGFGEYAEGDPLEVYTALFYAIKANYPKYIDPLFGAPEIE